MKKRELTSILLAACLLTAACTNSPRQAKTPNTDSIPVTPRADSALVETFAGTSLTGPDASEWHLSVMHARHSGDGTFRLTIKREGTAPDTYTGRRYTLRGTEEDINATVWQCLVDTAHYFDFLLTLPAPRHAARRVSRPHPQTATCKNRTRIIKLNTQTDYETSSKHHHGEHL